MRVGTKLAAVAILAILSLSLVYAIQPVYAKPSVKNEPNIDRPDISHHPAPHPQKSEFHAKAAERWIRIFRAYRLELEAYGEATGINATSTEPTPASLSLKLVAHRIRPHIYLVRILGGNLTVGDETYTIGRGIAFANLAADKVHGFARVQDVKPGRLILHGWVGDGEDGVFPVRFDAPQSKLVGRWFLSLEGKAVVVSPTASTETAK